jgi:hypothetical protein
LSGDFTINLTYEDVYKILQLNDNNYKSNTLNLFIRQNLYGIFRTYYETTHNTYDINKKSEKDLCTTLINLFRDNVYLITNIIDEINKDTFKKNIDEILLEDIKTYILKNTDLEFYDKLDQIVKKINSQSQLLPTIATNIQINIETNIQEDIEIEIEVQEQDNIQQQQYTYISSFKEKKYGLATFKNNINEISKLLCDTKLKELYTHIENTNLLDCFIKFIADSDSNKDKINLNKIIEIDTDLNKNTILSGNILNTNLLYTFEIPSTKVHINRKYSFVGYITIINNKINTVNVILLDIFSLNMLIYLISYDKSSDYEYQINTFKNYSIYESDNFENQITQLNFTRFYVNFIANFKMICYDKSINLGIDTDITKINKLVTQNVKYTDIISHYKLINYLGLNNKKYMINDFFKLYIKDKLEIWEAILTNEITEFKKFKIHNNEKLNNIYKLILHLFH